MAARSIEFHLQGHRAGPGCSEHDSGELRSPCFVVRALTGNIQYSADASDERRSLNSSFLSMMCVCRIASYWTLVAKLLNYLLLRTVLLFFAYFFFRCLIYSVSQKHKKNPRFSDIFPRGWEFLTNFLHTYYAFTSTLDYKFLFKCL